MGKSFAKATTEKKDTILLLTAVILGVILAFGGIYMTLAMLDPYDCRILEGVSIGGLDVGGMTRNEAKRALKAAAEESLLSLSLKVALPGETIRLSPKDAGLKLSAGKAVKAAYDVGRAGDAAREQADAQQAKTSGYAIGLRQYLKWNEVSIRAILKNYALQWDTALTQPAARMEGTVPELKVGAVEESAACPVVMLTLGLPERHLDVDAVYGEIITFYDQAIALAQAGTYAIAPEVTPEELPQEPDLEAIYAQYCVEPVNDSLDMEAYIPVPGSYGCRFDMEAAKAAVEEANYGETISLPMEYVQPEIMGEAVYFRDILGTCETKHSDNENRNTNLRLLCEFLNGVIVQPGEEFSYNGSVGERTAERGFKPAPAYSGNRLIQDYGGGVCQGSTTLYNCLLIADMEILERHCHGAPVSYIPRGLDAAVNWATKTDLRFRNNSHFPVKIQAEVSDGYVKMRLLGTDEKDYYIEMESSSNEDEKVIYAVSRKCKYDKETKELISREIEARSTYYKSVG